MAPRTDRMRLPVWNSPSTAGHQLQEIILPTTAPIMPMSMVPRMWVDRRPGYNNRAAAQGPRIKSSTFSGVHLKRTRDRAKDGTGIHGNARRGEVARVKVPPSFADWHPQVLRQAA